MPADGKLEARLGPNVLLVDVVDQLPRARPYPMRKSEIDRLIVHHSGALGRDGYAGIEASARYAITPKKPDGTGGRGFPGFSYTFWAPFNAPRSGPLVLYRGNYDNVRSNHTTKFNNRGVAIVLQGNLTKRAPSTAQIAILEAFLPWAIARYELSLPDELVWHSLVGKKRACPGGPTVAWLEAYRQTHR